MALALAEPDAATPPRRRVLVLARHFPPIGGAGVHRTLGSVRYLPAYGYEPIVVTGPAEHVDRWNPRDPGMLDRVPHGTEVHRLAGPEPGERSGWPARAQRLCHRPGPRIDWWVRGAYEMGRRVGVGAELILCSGVPYETTQAAARLSRELGIPWVADLEDPWALDEMRVEPTWLNHRVELARMRRALASAAAIVMCADEAAERMRRALPELAGRIVTAIPIGFDRDDFTAPAQPRDDDAFRIVHTGSMHTELGLRHRGTRTLRRLLGGTSVDVDILTRSHVVLLEAIERLRASEPELGERIEVHLAGELTAGDRAVAEGHPFVRMPGLLPHRETVGLMRSADLLFLPMYDLPRGRRAGLVPYKTYEYLAAERPILAAVPDGDVRDLLARVRHASLCRPSDVRGMAEAIRRAVAGGRVERVEDGIASPALQHLERRRTVARIATVLDDVLGVGADARAPRALVAAGG
jgi:glycosyltransferase involved in cell wall biosynthesis